MTAAANGFRGGSLTGGWIEWEKFRGLRGILPTRDYRHNIWYPLWGPMHMRSACAVL
jgi:hypothetical protein